MQIRLLTGATPAEYGIPAHPPCPATPIPFHTVPFRSVPFRSIPYRSVPLTADPERRPGHQDRLPESSGTVPGCGKAGHGQKASPASTPVISPSSEARQKRDPENTRGRQQGVCLNSGPTANPAVTRISGSGSRTPVCSGNLGSSGPRAVPPALPVTEPAHRLTAHGRRSQFSRLPAPAPWKSSPSATAQHSRRISSSEATKGGIR